MRQSHLILSNAAVMWAARLLAIVPPLALVPYLLGTIGEAGYGVYALVWPLLMSVEQLQQSLQSGVVKYGAGLLAENRTDDLNRIFSSSFAYGVLIAAVAAAATLTAAGLYDGPSEAVRMALIVVGIVVLFLFPLTPYIAMIQSKQRFYVGAIADTAAKYASLAAVVAWFSTIGPSVEALIVIVASSLFLSRLVQVPIAHRLIPGLRNRFRSIDRTGFRQIGAFGAATVLASACLAVNSTGVRWIMDDLASSTFVAHLAIMLMPELLLAQLISGVTVTVMPATSAYAARRDHNALCELLSRGIRYTMVLAVSGVLVAALLMRSAFELWLGPAYAFLVPYAIALILGGAFLLSTSVAHHMLKGLGSLRAVVLTYFIGLVLVPISVLVSVFHLSADPYLAVTSGLVMGQLVTGCLQIAACTAALQADLSTVVRRAYLQILSLAAIVAAVALVAGTISPLDGLPGRAVLALASVAAFLGATYRWVASPSERTQLSQLVRSLTQRFASNARLREAT